MAYTRGNFYKLTGFYASAPRILAGGILFLPCSYACVSTRQLEKY